MSFPASNAIVFGARTGQQPAQPSLPTQQDEGVEQLFANICRLRDGNNKLIEQTDEKAKHKVNVFRYTAPPTVEDGGRVCAFKVKEERVMESIESLTTEWKWNVELIELFDMFNLKIDYKCETYADLCRLNKEMFDAATRYNMFYDDDSKKGRVGECGSPEETSQIGSRLHQPTVVPKCVSA